MKVLGVNSFMLYDKLPFALPTTHDICTCNMPHSIQVGKWIASLSCTYVYGYGIKTNLRLHANIPTLQGNLWLRICTWTQPPPGKIFQWSAENIMNYNILWKFLEKGMCIHTNVWVTVFMHMYNGKFYLNILCKFARTAINIEPEEWVKGSRKCF